MSEPVRVVPIRGGACVQLDKRTYLPCKLEATCPKCSRTVTRDLMDQYLSYPMTNTITDVDMFCCDEDDTTGGCGHEFRVQVVVKLTVTAPPASEPSE